jgi:hypothetical protein
MSFVLVDIGISTSYDYFFEVAWPNHVEFTRRPSPITALNAAWPYWHLHEWHFWEHNPTAMAPDLKKFEPQVLRECPELGWLRDIAEAGKHFQLNRQNPPVKVKSISTRHCGGGYGSGALGEGALGETVAELLVVDIGGATHDLRAVVGAAFRYWLGKLLPHPVEIRLAPDNRDELCERMLDWCRTNLGDEREPKWKWALLQGANSPDYVQRLAFHEASTAEAFKRWWAGSNAFDRLGEGHGELLVRPLRRPGQMR